jgi:hypothetical protein
MFKRFKKKPVEPEKVPEKLYVATAAEVKTIAANEKWIRLRTHKRNRYQMVNDTLRQASKEMENTPLLKLSEAMGWDPPKSINDMKKDIEQQYFTPEIEDIRIGYQCEVKSGDTWVLVTVNGDILINIAAHLAGGMLITPEGVQPFVEFRTPYLTREQIEADGWVEMTIERWDPYLCFEKGNYWVIFDPRNMAIRILAKDLALITFLDNAQDQFRVTLACKDINTFRYICKLIGI